MWRLTALLLTVCSLGTAVPQGYNYPNPNEYLPPTPSDTSCQVAPVTSYTYQTRFNTRYQTVPVNQVDTRYITTTLFQQQVVPTTVFRTQVQTRVQTQQSVVQSVSNRVEQRFITQTVPGQNVQRTSYATTTRVVPQVNYVTQTQVRTQVVPVEVTRTQVRSINQQFTQTQTRDFVQTQVQTIPGRDVVRTVVNTVRQTSVIQQQLPGRTQIITSTRVQNTFNTQTIPGRNVVSTRVVQSQQVIPTTVVRTDVQQRFDTRTQFVTRTNVQFQTRIQTQFVPQEVVSTRVVPQEIFSTVVQTQFRPFTQVQTVVSTQFNRGQDSVQTRYETRQSVVQVPGQNQVITRNVVSTQVRQEIAYQTVNRANEVVVTVTSTRPCANTGYNYNAPAVPFNF